MLRAFLLSLCFLSCAAKVVDLSHNFRENETVYLLDLKQYRLENKFKGPWSAPSGSVWVTMEEYGGHSHGGTHMDAPIHVAESESAARGLWSLEAIPPERLMGPLRVINVEAQAARDPNYALTVSDITRLEQRYGRIPQGAIVIMNSGWYKRYPNREQYLGPEGAYQFPGFSAAAAQYLATNRDIHGAGVDTASLDIWDHFGAHTKFLGNRIFGLEMVGNLDKVPEAGALAIASPIKSYGASGGPCRVLVVWGEGSYLSSTGGVRASAALVVLLSCFVLRFLNRAI